MPTPDLYVNDHPLTNFGFVAERIDGWDDSPGWRDRSVVIPGRAGELLASDSPVTSPRDVVVRGVLRQSTLALRQSALHQLRDRCAFGVVRLRMSSDPTLELFARLRQCVAVPVPPQLVNPYQRAELRFEALDPYRYAIAGSIVTASTVLAAVPLGTAPSWPMLLVYGAATNPVITYRNAAGAVVATLGFTITLAAADYLEVNCETMQVTKVVTGVRTEDPTLLTSGDFFALDPQDGDYVTSSWPTLEVSAGTLEAQFKEAYL